MRLPPVILPVYGIELDELLVETVEITRYIVARMWIYLDIYAIMYLRDGQQKTTDILDGFDSAERETWTLTVLSTEGF